MKLLAALALLVGAAIAPVSARAEPSSAGAARTKATLAEVGAWLDAQMEKGRDLPLGDLRDVAFSFAYEFHTLRPPAEIEQLRREVQGHPDHPMRRVVEGYERVLKEGPPIVEYTARVRGWNEWRLSQDRPPGDSTAWNDTVVTASLAYQLNPDQIALIDPRVGYPPERQLNALSNELWNAVDALFYGDLGARPGQEATRGEVRVDADRWSCDVHRSGQTIRFEGRWVPEWSRGIVERATVVASPDGPQYVGWARVFHDWRMDSVLGRPVAARAEQRFADGSIAYAYIFRGAAREAPEVFAQVTATPDIAGADPLRGPITATSMWDYRQGEQRYVSDLQGERHIIDRGPLPGVDAKSDARLLRRIGWALLGTLVLGLIAIWIRRHAQ